MNKKLLIAATIAYTGIAGTFIACQKEEKTATSNNVSKIGGSFSLSDKITFDAGHPSNQCNGQGLCTGFMVGYKPQRIHIPCQGPGKDCHHEITIGFNLFSTIKENAPTNLNLPIDGENGAYFLMPDRSMMIPESGKYLNVPKQTLEKNGDGTYLFKNVVLTSAPLYTND